MIQDISARSNRDMELMPEAGLFQLVMQGGALAILGYFLLFRLPSMHAQIADTQLAVSKLFSDAQVDAAITYQGIINTLQNEFQRRNERIVDSIERQTAALKGEFLALRGTVANAGAK